MQDKFYNMLLQDSEVTWQSIIQELIKSEELDPWNIDLSILTTRYMQRIKELEEHNFFISGKVLLASALLLRIKSHKFLTEHISDFDNQLFPPEPDLLEETEEDMYEDMHSEFPPLLIKTPQQRKRQITVNDLMKALEKALEVDERRKQRRTENERVFEEAAIPEKKYDITQMIKDVYSRLLSFFKQKQTITFDELAGQDSTREDKIQTFIPLLHLSNDQKIDLDQEVPFGAIKITLTDE